MNSLSIKQAQRCEDASEPTCKCRCAGALHGAKRGTVLALPKGDPHSMLKTCNWCKGTGYWDLNKKVSCSKCRALGVCLPNKYQELLGSLDSPGLPGTI